MPSSVAQVTHHVSLCFFCVTVVVPMIGPLVVEIAKRPTISLVTPHVARLLYILPHLTEIPLHLFSLNGHVLLHG